MNHSLSENNSITNVCQRIQQKIENARNFTEIEEQQIPHVNNVLQDSHTLEGVAVSCRKTCCTPIVSAYL